MTQTQQQTYAIRHVSTPPALHGAWDGPAWRGVTPIPIDRFHAKSSEHRPRVQAKLLYDDATLHVLFRVEDQYVKAACTEYGQMVCRDSCVEIFLQPRPDRGYFNFETNCGGTMLLWYIEDPTPAPGGGLRRSVEVPADDAASIGIYHSMPRHVPDEIAQPVEWRLQLAVPVALLEKYVGPLRPLAGSEWQGNLFKCADATSHPHWAAWSPIGNELNFHAPQYFGRLRFEPTGQA